MCASATTEAPVSSGLYPKGNGGRAPERTEQSGALSFPEAEVREEANTLPELIGFLFPFFTNFPDLTGESPIRGVWGDLGFSSLSLSAADYLLGDR